ncbi:MAG TPA: hypothetical protein VL096_03845, partial [Pirellulaceae bacterium]|nr:hypothetical protein [Pirellulaceae bacterium]
MELFTVTCTTCQSRLKVRERQVIGQILACPKCQGMVLVQPPAGWVDPGEQATAAPIVAAPVSSPHSTTEHVAESTFDEAAVLLSRRNEPAAPPMHDDAFTEPLPPGTDWTTPAQRMRRWLLIGGLSSIGAIGLIVLLVLSLRSEPEEVAQVETPPTEVVEPPAEATPPPVEPMPETTEPVVPEPAPEPVKPPEPMPPTPEEIKPEPKPPAPETPPDLAPAPGETEPKPNDKPKPLNTFNVENTLKDFGALIEDKPFDKPAQPGDAAPPAEPMPASEEQVDEEPLPRPDQRKIDIARRLADPLEAVEMTDMPLADFLQFATDLSTIPFTLEPGTLPAIKASPETKISVSLKKTNVSALLAAGLGPHNLAFVAGESGIVVLPSASAQGKLRQIKHDVSDLAKDEASVQALAELIPAVVDPAAWQASGGPGELAVEGSSLVVTQSPEVHFSLMVLLEKLRLARKLPTRTQYPATVLTLTPRYTAAQ